MSNSTPRRTAVRLIALVAVSTLLALAYAAAPASARARVSVTLSPVGTRYVGDAIPIKGYVSHAPRGKHKLKLQAYSGGHWVTRATKYVRNGPYRFASQRATAPGRAKFRTALFAHGRRIGVSNVISVPVALRPAPAPAPPPACSAPPVSAPSPGPLPNPLALLPDIGVRTLGQFSIVYADGKKLLKFPAVTSNIGKGPLEIRATRPTSDPSDTNWVSHQVVHNSDNSTQMLPATGAQFFYALDGHNHWHIRDFDLYELLSCTGAVQKLGEKHGFCFEDNTTYRDWAGSPNHPEVPTSPVYTHEISCGQGDPSATSILYGLSVGWGDTYPVSLPNQAIDITGIPDGFYIVRVTTDWQNFWQETNESNNSASAEIQISGNTVTLISATDGL